MKFNVVILQPPGYVQSMVFLEAADYVRHALRRAGYQAGLTKNRMQPDAINVVFGSHLPMPEALEFPPGTVLFNTEQLEGNALLVTDAYRALLHQHFVWDYSASNLRAVGHDRVALFPFSYVPELARVAKPETPDVDLVFYGSMNPHRHALLTELRTRGLRVAEVNGLFADERDAVMARGRAVLNLHYYPTQVLQQVRCFYALCNGIPVISENYPVDSAPAVYQDSLLTPGPRDFVEYVVDLLGHEDAFQDASRQSLLAFQGSKDAPVLAGTIAQTIKAQAPQMQMAGTVRVPDRINLCDGGTYRPGWLNIGTVARHVPDISLNLSAPLPQSAGSALWGDVPLMPGMATQIDLGDMPARVVDLQGLMQNCLTLLQDGGELKASVPFDLSANRHPDHLRQFTIESWRCYTDRFWEQGWFTERFTLTRCDYVLSAMGKQRHANGTGPEELLTIPRAVDAMRVVLTKTRTTPQDRTLARGQSEDWAGALM
jgi:hypothetical protein